MKVASRAAVAFSALLAAAPGACTQGARVAPLRYGASVAMPEEAFRAIVPEASPVPVSASLPFRFARLPNGTRIVHLERRGLPTVSLRLVIDRGAADAGAPVHTFGVLGALAAAGTAERTEAELAWAYADLGAGHGTSFDGDGCVLAAKVRAASMDAAVSILAETALRPRFADLDAVKKRWRADFEASGGLGRNMAILLFGRAHAYGFARPREEQIEALRVDDVRALHARLFQPAHATLMVIGDASPEAVDASAGRWLGKWPASHDPVPRAAEIGPAPGGARVVLRDRTWGAHTQVWLLARGPSAGDPRLPAAEVLAGVLGGLVSSPLRRAVRAEHAAAYHFGAYLGVRRAASYFQIGGTIERDQTVAMVSAVRTARAQGVDEAAVERSRTSLLAEWRTALATNEGIAALATDALRHGLPLDGIAARVNATQAVTASDVRRVAEECLGDASLRLVVEGDAATMGDLASLGLGEVERRNDVGEYVRQW